MDLYIQTKYLGMISYSLDRFKKTSETVWNCRCPYCGDSNKSSSKARGYFYVKDNDLKFKCHNCFETRSFRNFMKDNHPSMYSEMIIEAFGEKTKPKKFDETMFIPKTVQRFAIDAINMMLPLTDPRSGLAVDYLNGRAITAEYHSKFMFVPSMRDFVAAIGKYTEKTYPDIPCLAIPFKLQGNDYPSYVQLRNLDPSSNFRYLTLETGVGEKIFGEDGLDYGKRVSVLEGALDAVFIPNSVAIAGAADKQNIQRVLDKTSNVRFIFDSDYATNPDIKEKLNERINQGYEVVIYDRAFPYKDINDAIKAGMSVNETNTYLNSRTFKGLRAKLELLKA